MQQGWFRVACTKGLTFYHYRAKFLACAKYATHVVVTSRIDLI